MKKSLMISLSVVVAVWLGLRLVAQPANVITERTVYTLPSTNLNAARIRVAIATATLNGWLQFEVRIQRTNDAVIDRQLFWMTPNQHRTWMNASNMNATLKTFILNNVDLNADTNQTDSP